MKEPEPYTFSPRFTTLERDLLEIKKEYVDDTIRWYEHHVPWNRILFRSTGIIIIACSVSIPYLSGLTGPWREIGVPVASLTVALLTGLNAFFGWQATWQKNITMKLHMQQLEVMWRFRMAEARHAKDEDDACQLAVRATEELLGSAGTAVGADTSRYFEGVRSPTHHSSGK